MHKFRIGQIVQFVAPATGKHGSSGAYTVTRLLPEGREGPQYRLISNDRQVERVAQEGQLRDVAEVA